MPDVIYMHSSKAGALGRLADIGFKNIVLYNPHGWAFNMNNISVIKKKVYALIEKVLAYDNSYFCLGKGECYKI